MHMHWLSDKCSRSMCDTCKKAPSLLEAIIICLRCNVLFVNLVPHFWEPLDAINGPVLMSVVDCPAACIISARVPDCCLSGVPSTSETNQSHRASYLENQGECSGIFHCHSAKRSFISLATQQCVLYNTSVGTPTVKL